ncbi:hypothetical protein [Burkholderia gladioli]|uniref:hypothetical protein n=1 Tax=Burkholderia gladioli TaxID=28095 RepID=UPI0016403127|nr:hypothetical protein [Burkholderia gladioli]MDN7753803.1 hypothetical protein [Burkholderia gladioli]
MTKRKPLRDGYSINHTVVGWWVDGFCGYLVAGYFEAEELAVAEAGKAIAAAKSTGCPPVWLIRG